MSTQAHVVVTAQTFLCSFFGAAKCVSFADAQFSEAINEAKIQHSFDDRFKNIANIREGGTVMKVQASGLSRVDSCSRVAQMITPQSSCYSIVQYFEV